MKKRVLLCFLTAILALTVLSGCSIQKSINADSGTDSNQTSEIDTPQLAIVGWTYLNPVAYWSFDQNEGNFVRDNSGSGADGNIAAGDATCGVEAGKFGRAAYFNNDTRAGDILVKDQPGFQIANQMTIAVWVRPMENPIGGGENILNKWYDWGDAYWFGLNDQGKIEFAISFEPGFENDFRVISTQPLPSGEWTHCSGVYNGRELILYINGVVDSRTVLPSAYQGKSIRKSNHDIHIGNYPYLGYKGLKMLLDELWFFNCSLSQFQVNKIMTTSPSQIKWSVKNPGFTPPAGVYSGPVNAAISCVTSGATIIYTTDGSTPSSTHGLTYSGPIAIEKNTTIRAIALKSGWIDSQVVSARYILLSEPKNLTVNLKTMSSIILVWNKPDYTGSGYPGYIVTCESSDGSYHIIATNYANYFIINSLKSSQNYIFTVKAVDFLGYTSSAASIFVTTLKRSSPMFNYPISNATALGYFIDTGADLYAPTNTPCYAIADGGISIFSRPASANKILYITNTPFLWTDCTGKKFTIKGYSYAHLNAYSSDLYHAAYSDKFIKYGTLVAYSGAANNTPHLHFTFITGEENFHEIRDPDNNLLRRITWGNYLNRDQVYELLGLEYGMNFTR